MTLRNLFFWFFSTLFIGASSIFLFMPFLEVKSFSQQLLVGLTLASVTLLGFFSYLVFHWLCRGLFHKQKTFHIILSALLLVVLINFTYLCIHQPLPYYPILLAIPIGMGSLVAYVKSKMTHWNAFVPTLFFMIVATILEATPAFQSRLGPIPFSMILQTMGVILLCNAWQILNLHRWIGREREKRSKGITILP